MKPVAPMKEDAASSLGARLVAKANEIIEWVGRHHKADTAWKQEAEMRFKQLEREVAELKAQNRGLKIAKGKAGAAKAKAVEAQRAAEAKLGEVRRLLQ